VRPDRIPLAFRLLSPCSLLQARAFPRTRSEVARMPVTCQMANAQVWAALDS
jgi:hypothetical protein